MRNHINYHLVCKGAAGLFLFVLLAGCATKSTSVEPSSVAVTEDEVSDSGVVAGAAPELPDAAADAENLGEDGSAHQVVKNDANISESVDQAATQPQKPVYDKGDVIWIQQRLKDLGYYDGPVDGSVGKATRGAVRDYQKDQDVNADGQPTTELREFMWLNGG